MQRNLSSIIIYLTLPLLLSGNGQAKGNVASGPLLSENGDPASGINTGVRDIMDRIEMLCVYSIKDGKLKPNVLVREDIGRGGQLSVDGHVCGLVVLCEKDLEISVDGQAMSKIRENPDGTFSAKDYGRLPLKELVMSKPGSSAPGLLETGNRVRLEGKTYLGGGYSFFPGVIGDSVTPEGTFHITFQSDGKRFDLAVQQDGYRTLNSLRVGQAYKEKEIVFRYVGARFDTLGNRPEDFDERLRAIVEGIGAVERTFKMDLIGYVNIIDFEGIHDAVTTESSDTIWFYADAFLKEPLAELKSIAEHESLHKLVRRKGITISSELRDLFADLKGYDDFSYERFLIATKGICSFQETNDTGCDNLFFAFINEKNFIEGMKGGHAQANLDEFCTSFMHSVMYLDRLGNNLTKPLKLAGTETSRQLTSDERKSIAGNYLKTLQAMINTLSEESKTGALENDSVGGFLLNGLETARRTRDTGFQS